MTMTTGWSPKDPEDVRDYWIDFTSLLAAGETITASTVTVAPLQHAVEAPLTDLTKDDDDHTDAMVRVRLSGGIPSEEYTVEFHITTSTNQQFDLTKTLEMKERTA